jgi:zinc/manganese transport system permease protein
MYDFFIAPFDSFLFMRRALAACFALSLGCAPMGVLLVLRRMSLMGDALSHSILPGVALGYMIAGLSLPVMGLGGMIAGLLIACTATLVSRYTILREDASFVGFYLIALSSGALMVSATGNNVDLLHILFGQILSVTPESLILIAAITSCSLIVLAIIYRALLLECFDPIFMRSIKVRGSLYHMIFMMLVVLNLISAFQALGTLMALGMMMLPAIAARFWGREVWSLFLFSFFIALLSGYLGLLVSYHFAYPSGPSIIMIAGGAYILSLFFGSQGSLLKRGV